MSRRAIFVGFTAALTVGVLGLPAGAKTTSPCKILKKSEIAASLGSTVSSGQPGLSTPVSKSCDFDVAASNDRPDGKVIVRVTTIGAKAAYDGLKDQTALYVAVPELGKALYSEKTGALSLLLGSKYLTVQGVFLATDPLPVHQVDVESQLVDLMKIARKRV
jgi:hypothetical protein